MHDGASLAMEHEVLVDLSVVIASRRADALDRALHLASRFSPGQAVEEILLQAHLFVGFPIAIEAFPHWRSIGPEEPQRSVDGADPESQARWAGRGEEVCRTVYGGNYAKLRENVTRIRPDLDQWMVIGGYGRVIGRRGPRTMVPCPRPFDGLRLVSETPDCRRRSCRPGRTVPS
ncbi:MAG: hypothetical protein WD737_00705 [Gemmatimonadota bacterium]